MKYQNITVSEAAKLLGKSTEIIYLGLQQGVFPWGAAIRVSPDRCNYVIYPKLFYEIVGNVEMEGEDEK